MVLCIFLGYGIAGAAWATVASQVVAAYMMIQTLNEKGYNAFAFSVPSVQEIWTILGLAAPVFVTMMSKVAFYSLLIYSSTSMGTHTMAAHQVMVQSFCMCTARILLKSLVIIGATLGLLLGIVGTSVPWLFPNIFTPDQMVIQEAGRDLRFICLPMSGCFTLGALVLLILSGRYGLQGCCFALAGFQWARFSIALQRLLSPNGMLYSEESGQYKQQS